MSLLVMSLLATPVIVVMLLNLFEGMVVGVLIFILCIFICAGFVILGQILGLIYLLWRRCMYPRSF